MKEESMNLLCAVFLEVFAATPGLVWNKNGQFLSIPTFQSHISQAYAAERIQMDATAPELIQLGKQWSNLIQQPNALKTARRESTRFLTLRGIAKGNYRSLAKLVRKMSWHSPRYGR